MTLLDGGVSAKSSATDQTANQLRRPRLLVIDDAEVHRLIICKIAAKAGLEAMEAESCGDVVRLTTLNEFECATLDLSLGERAGTEVLRHFSICGFRAPIIILSGADHAVAQYAFGLGQSLDLNMTESLGKPVDLAQLRARFSSIVSDWQEQHPAK